MKYCKTAKKFHKNTKSKRLQEIVKYLFDNPRSKDWFAYHFVSSIANEEIIDLISTSVIKFYYY